GFPVTNRYEVDTWDPEWREVEDDRPAEAAEGVRLSSKRSGPTHRPPGRLYRNLSRVRFAPALNFPYTAHVAHLNEPFGSDWNVYAICFCTRRTARAGGLGSDSSRTAGEHVRPDRRHPRSFDLAPGRQARDRATDAYPQARHGDAAVG